MAHFLDLDGLSRFYNGLKNKFAAKSHLHSGADITSGTIPAARLPAATTSAQGAMSAEDKSKLNAMYTVAQRTSGLGASETLNPFDPLQNQRIMIDRLDNAFYFIDKRCTVTAVRTNGQGNTTQWSSDQIARLFNMIEGDSGSDRLYTGDTLVITLDFSSMPNNIFPNYPYGYVYVNAYYNRTFKSVSARVYGKHTGTEFYWSNLPCSLDPKSTASCHRWIITQTGMYNMQKLEITVVATDDTSSFSSISDITYYMTRASSNKDMPYVSKLREESLYYNLTAPGFIGPLTGTVNGYTIGKSVPSDAVFTDTVYTHPSHTAKSSGLYKVTVDSLGHVSAAAAVEKADITGLGVPGQDTTYSAATTSADGLMSSTDKTKLDGLTEITTAQINTILAS